MKSESHDPPQADQIVQEQPPLGKLVGQLTDDLKLLARREIELAKHELSDSVERVEQRVAAMALGVAALAGGALVLLTAAVLALSLVWPAWAAALVVGGLVSVIGLLLAIAGKAKLAHVRLKPTRTIESVERDVAAIKGAAS